ncbi:tocopherol cyclase family protein [Carnobacterium pleistocenium]|uniref:tocopherol cyclase family protein n=1 Tax=Carnobacterium pleistocenium TaxID=181073 RepID=UPI0005583C26|nr:tocopherol cyclase family protein [Carnobacterium pleistocenium]
MFGKIRNPVLFQGNLHRESYFEGWYYKQVSCDEKTSISFIPGVNLFNGDEHSFIQYIYMNLNEQNEKITKTGYIRYRLDEFSYQDDPFLVQIGQNIFTESFISVQLKDKQFMIQGKLGLGNFQSIKTTLLSPSIMGGFAYVPKMECYHGLISMNHRLQGTLTINDKDIVFTNGKGYIEKDWGTSFPKEYVWIHSNHFKNPNTSLFLSIAHIPFHIKTFKGFICNLIVNDIEYRFATYNSSKVRILDQTKDSVTVILENKEAELTIKGMITYSGKLIAPENGSMNKAIKEGLSGEVNILLKDKKRNTMYRDISNLAGIEIVEA